ncbi:Neural cell adhesion molecule 1, partial [Orchesella cincta]
MGCVSRNSEQWNSTKSQSKNTHHTKLPHDIMTAMQGQLVSNIKKMFIVVPPMIWVPNQLVGAMEGDDVTLECHSEAYPKSINYWTKLNGDIIVSGEKYEPILEDNTYKVTMRLTIRGVSASDYGTYVCLSKKFSLGNRWTDQIIS